MEKSASPKPAILSLGFYRVHKLMWLDISRQHPDGSQEKVKALQQAELAQWMIDKLTGPVWVYPTVLPVAEQEKRQLKYRRLANLYPKGSAERRNALEQVDFMQRVIDRLHNRPSMARRDQPDFAGYND